MSLDLIESFISLKTPATQRAYRAALNVVAEFLGFVGISDEFVERMAQFSASDAARFYSYLRQRKTASGEVMADATVSQRFHLIRRLFRYLTALGVVDRNVFDAIHNQVPWRQRKQKRPTKLIPFDAIEKILALPDRRTKVGRRDYCILCLLFGGGLRRSEVYNLNVGDVEVSPSGVLSLVLRHTKNGSNQTQSLPLWAAEAFTSLVSQRGGEGANNSDPLFTYYFQSGRPRNRLANKTIYRIYRTYTEKAGLGEISPHSARATAATYLKAKKNYNYEDIARFLRHTSSRMVEIYDKRAHTPETNPGIAIDFLQIAPRLETADALSEQEPELKKKKA